MLNRLKLLVQFLKGDFIIISSKTSGIEVDWGRCRPESEQKRQVAVDFFKTACNLS